MLISIDLNNYSKLCIRCKMKVYESANADLVCCCHLDRRLDYTISPKITVFRLEKKCWLHSNLW